MAATAQQSSVGYGFLDPDVYNSEYSTLRFIIRQMISKLDTMKLVKVLRVQGGGGAIAAAGTVDVQPLVSLIDGQGNLTTPAKVNGIPWWRLGGDSNAIICDPAVGDIGYVLCADRGSAAVIASKAQSAPDPPGRRYNIADGIYIGKLLADAPKQFIAFTSSGIQITDSNGNMITMGSSGLTIKGNVAVTGNLSVNGSVIAGFGGSDQIGLQTHTHTSAAAGQQTSIPTAGT